MLIAKCWSKNTIKKKADNAIANFLPTEEFKIPLIEYDCLVIDYKDTLQSKFLQKDLYFIIYLELLKTNNSLFHREACFRVSYFDGVVTFW